jgi:predicted ATPase/DNA-binding CsgD family transcriptional regulator
MARRTRIAGNLPAEATSFVGRRRDLAEIRRKVAAGRLISLVGPGGVGKTRLALRAATDLARAFADGAWLVELADVRDPGLVSNAMAAALDLRDQAATEPLPLLLSYLRDKELLIVLDNCEHLLEPAALLVTEIMKGASGVRVIATSREPLTVAGEHVVPVPPLELPSPDTTEGLARLRQNEAVLLFTERAAAAAGKFELTPSNRAAVANLCRRLDGLPLAIELAAVRTRVLSVEQMLDRLADRFNLLTGGDRAALPRHQTIRTTIDWSYDLLTPEEQTLLRRLCVFAGRFTLDDVESVCAVDSPTLEVLSSLVDKSLVLKEDVRGRACYRLHETMREYAILKLREADEAQAIGDQCSEYYRLTCLQSIGEARFHLDDWLGWMDLEIDNIRAVLRHCVTSNEFSNGIDLVFGTGWFWITRATTEGVRWLDELLVNGAGNPGTLGWAYFLRGFLAVLQSDPAAAQPALAQSVTKAREFGQPDVLAHALSLSCIAAYMADDRASATSFLDEAEAAVGQIDDVPAKVSLLQARALGGLFVGDLDAVKVASAEGARLTREIGDLYSHEMMLMNLGYATMLSGDLAASKPMLEEAMRIAQRIDDRIALYALLDVLGYLAAASNQSRLAAQLLGAAESVRTGAGASLIAFLSLLLAQAEESAVAALGASKFKAEYELGKSMSREAAIKRALGETSKVTPAESNGLSALGKREVDVARLVAEGLSNKQIGTRLFISERTVDSHVQSILNKLGFNSRAQIAAWIASSNS